MSARLGIITQQGLGEALRKQFSKPLAKLITAILVISSIAIGNAAFETGNILGASIGLASIFTTDVLPIKYWVLIIGIFTFILLIKGSYKLIEKVLIALVIVMSVTFIATAIFVSPQISSILKGMFIPSIPKGSLLALVGLIGTTVVPYNLFLHASAVKERWSKPGDLPEARLDITISVVLGGLISMAIVITSAVAFWGTGNILNSTADLGVQVEPLLGKWARYIIGIGLFSAGISSAITAPLAAAYATMGILGWEKNIKSAKSRMVWVFILLTGTTFSMIGFKPIEAIVFAQVTNGILLPVVAIFLLWVMNYKPIMGVNTNGLLSNILGIIVVLITFGLGLLSLAKVFGLI